MPKQLPTTAVLLERELIVYRRERSDIWQCRYKVDGRWIRRTTKEYELEKAKLKADRLRIEDEIRAEKKLPLITRRFKDVALITLDEIEKELKQLGLDTTSRKYKDYYTVITNYLNPILGKRYINKIDYDALDELRMKREELMGKAPTHSTLLTHNAVLNRVFKQASIMGYITAESIPQLDLKGKKTVRRPSFSYKEVQTLLSKLEGWKDKTINKQSQLMRELLFDYVVILLDTGARPGKELYNLLWQQVEPQIDPIQVSTGKKNKNGKEITKTDLRRSVLMTVTGKTGTRQMVGHKDTLLALTRIAKRIYDVEFPVLYPLQNVATEKNEDKVILTSNKCKPTNFNNMFDKFLDEIKLAIDPVTKQKRVLYSLRHTYATFKLTYDKVPIHTLAKQMGTSVGMIEKHYSHLKIKDAVEQLRSDESRSLMNMITSVSDMDKDKKKLKDIR